MRRGISDKGQNLFFRDRTRRVREWRGDRKYRLNLEKERDGQAGPTATLDE